MTIIDGRAVADRLQEELSEKVTKLKAKSGVTPGLVVILVGDHPASQVYVRNKERSALKAGFRSRIVRLEESVSEEELLQTIQNYNNDSQWHGILVQLPLPDHIDENKVLVTISPEKDVDGFHPVNMGKLWLGQGRLVPSTPAGIMMLLKDYKVPLAGQRAVVIGRSNIVGKPIAQMLLDENATVTIAHSKTKNLAEIARQADILVVAVGRGHFVGTDFIKEGAVVIDVGMNRDDSGKLIGDVDFEAVKDKVSLITPVPKGVGPMTITMLLEQTYRICLESLTDEES